ncbi:MAG: SoxR reducing system RseC family protein [Mariprofundaceae bacterium]|nr:SoxR reducing system RseC family protein [Mariprofundaceae bacterium]
MRLQEIKEVSMEQAATVVDVMGHAALVRGRRASACGQCAGKSACGTLGSWVERFSEMRVANPLGARAGDEVIVSVPDGVLMRAAIRLYGVPMLGFFTAGFLFRYLAFRFEVASPELWAAGGALAGMIAVLVWFRYAPDTQAASNACIVRIKSRAVGVPVHAAGGH